MPLVLLLVCAPLVWPRPAGPIPQELPQRAVSVTWRQDARGKIAWFRGTYEELLAEAARTQRIVFLDFYARDNAFSKKLEKSTFSDPKVLSELADVLCYAVDTEDKQTKTLRKRFQVQAAPALVFLDPDGRLREQISGYHAPESFLAELKRIKSNKGTFSDLRARIQANPDDLDARWELACKRSKIGDIVGYEEQLSEIRERDREGRSAASRRMSLAGLYATASAKLEPDPLYRFVEAEKDRALLFEGWLYIWSLEGQVARSVTDPERVRRHELRYFAAARELWPLVPEEQHGRLGNNIAWSIYERRASASRADLEFALTVAHKAVAAAPEVPEVVDTLACCLFAVGKRDEALAQVERCIALDPNNPTWRERLAEFHKAR